MKMSAHHRLDHLMQVYMHLPFLRFLFGAAVGGGGNVGSASQSSSHAVARRGGGVVVNDFSKCCFVHVRHCGVLRASLVFGGKDETRYKCCCPGWRSGVPR